jgi:hypothetical protein
MNLRIIPITLGTSASAALDAGWVHCAVKAHIATFEMRYPVPTKKNCLRPGRKDAEGKGGGLRYKRGIREACLALTHLAILQWGERAPLIHPNAQWWFIAENDRQDRDGMYTTMIDVLKKAGVIKDDSIKYFNGLQIIHPAVVTRAPLEAGVRITLDWRDQ